MKFYDLHVHSAFSEGTSSIEELAGRGKLLGFSGICFSEYFEGQQQLKKLKAEIEKVKRKIGIDVFLGFEARSVKELGILKARRRLFDVLLARGGDLKLNRKACETAEVDILTHPEHGRRDSGLNHVLAKAAAKNNVAIEINFREILTASKKTRSRVMANMQTNIKLAKKYKAPIIICSDAISHWKLRDPRCLISMACQLGLGLKEAKAALTKVPESIIRQAIERKGKRWIMPGVKVIK